MPVFARLRALVASPLGMVLLAALLFRLPGLTWGLPAADGWDDDGVAPRDFLVGVVETFWPGHHYTYPPLHLLLLTVVTAPVWIVSLLRAPSLQPAPLVQWFLSVPTMTAFAVIARCVTIALSLGLLWNVARIGALLRGSARAGVWAAAACGGNAIFTYYSQTTNLDVPYLFWAFLALRWLVEAIVHRAPRELRRAMLFASLAVATKDQAYGLFVLGVPLSLAAWMALDREARPLAGPVAREVAIGAALALGALLLVDGAVTNPTGWVARVRFLLGSASEDFAIYAATPAGRLHAARDVLLSYDQFYPWPFGLLAVAGIAAALRARDGAARAAGLVPLLAAASFTVAFDMSARRSEHRFALPQMVVLGLYAGLALDAGCAWLWGTGGAEVRDGGKATRARRGGRVVFALACAALGGLALFRCASVDAALLLDPRYDAEAWMRANVRPGDSMEVYGINVQLPRLPADARVARVDLGPLEGRNPILGATEVQARYADVEGRRPKFIVVPVAWAWQYIVLPEWVEPTGRVFSKGQERVSADTESREYIHALREGRLRYRLAHTSTWTSRFWPRQDIHASVAREVWIFERVQDGS